VQQYLQGVCNTLSYLVPCRCGGTAQAAIRHAVSKQENRLAGELDCSNFPLVEVLQRPRFPVRARFVLTSSFRALHLLLQKPPNAINGEQTFAANLITPTQTNPLDFAICEKLVR
jgi:hypothetical protein